MTFPSGAAVFIDGRDLAIVRAAFPEGSTSLQCAHYMVDFVEGDNGVKVAMCRVGVVGYRQARQPAPQLRKK